MSSNRTRTTVLSLAFAAGALGLAAPVSADPLDGTYNATVIDGGGWLKQGVVKMWYFNPCGPDCTHVHNEGTLSMDMHQQGDTWTGSAPGPRGGTETVTVDKNTFVLTTISPIHTVVWQLAKGG